MGSTLPILYLSSPTPSPMESRWLDEDWDGERGRVIERERERKMREKQQMKETGETKNKKDAEQVPNDCHLQVLSVIPLTKKTSYPYVIQR